MGAVSSMFGGKKKPDSRPSPHPHRSVPTPANAAHSSSRVVQVQLLVAASMYQGEANGIHASL
jgi:hypothetical protein